ncbi:class I SAM-dependent methyltransferase [Halomonas sp. LR3S48]|uniref:class I SAM-dependent methyltransferase n=1 Tax=Halomonadaceae TaxID=28256 RepID=UPI0021E359E6|nr:class I SAM-dependent methyltransferase [Halomonas sp. LR3S48]UYG05775.1 class I SAM-dependent methyltransferase [Halomonas sp. LR3S48]
MKSPAAARNRQPIFDVLNAMLPERARILEVASGSGEHAVYMAEARPDWTWQPSDPNADARDSISAWREHAGLGNLLEPLPLDVAGIWPAGPFDAVVAINLVHISPWDVTEALMARSAERLREGGMLYLYGPYRRDGRHTAESNAAFDADLKARDPRWGVRDLESVVAEAQPHGFMLERTIEMPANNLSVVLRLHA